MTGDHPWGGVRRSAATTPELVAAALAEISRAGPVTDRRPRRPPAGAPPRGELVGLGATASGGRAPVLHGEVTAARRNGFTRSYMLPERWIPADVLPPPRPTPTTPARALLLVAPPPTALGTARDLADYYRINVPASAELLAELAADGALQQVRVEGWRPAGLPAPRGPPARAGCGRGRCCRRSTR